MVNIKYLRMIDRIAAWTLFGVIIIFLVSGWNMTGRIQLFPAHIALRIHRLTHIPLLILLFTHPAICVYRTIIRWRRKKRKG
ncbi:MAG: hypothetical protein KJ709_00390 [Nanoarchaeota archaeon]|nr:hypothetical protein [Nanoarchaeota archaeon]